MPPITLSKREADLNELMGLFGMVASWQMTSVSVPELPLPEVDRSVHVGAKDMHVLRTAYIDLIERHTGYFVSVPRRVIPHEEKVFGAFVNLHWTPGNLDPQTNLSKSNELARQLFSKTETAANNRDFLGLSHHWLLASWFTWRDSMDLLESVDSDKNFNRIFKVMQKASEYLVFASKAQTDAINSGQIDLAYSNKPGIKTLIHEWVTRLHRLKDLVGQFQETNIRVLAINAPTTGIRPPPPIKEAETIFNLALEAYQKWQEPGLAHTIVHTADSILEGLRKDSSLFSDPFQAYRILNLSDKVIALRDELQGLSVEDKSPPFKRPKFFGPLILAAGLSLGPVKKPELVLQNATVADSNIQDSAGAGFVISRSELPAFTSARFVFIQ